MQKAKGGVVAMLEASCHLLLLAVLKIVLRVIGYSTPFGLFWLWHVAR